MRRAWARLLSVFRKRRLDDELEAELRSHLDLAMEDYLRCGVEAAEARRLARLRFGTLDASREAHRDSRGWPWLEGLFYDIRFALRGLLRDRGFTLTAIVMLALAIGLNVSVFTVMDAMLFRGFPQVKNNDRLVYIQERDALKRCCIAYPDFLDWRKQAKSFEDIAFIGGKPIAFSDSDGGRFLLTFAAESSANTFPLLGVKPALGRDFLPSDETPGAPPVTILSYSFWEERLGKRSDIIGHRVRINKEIVTVIGVMPEGFWFPEQENLWMPAGPTPARMERMPTGFMAVGRLKAGATIETARAELATIGQRLADAYPATNRTLVPDLRDYAHFFVGPDAPLLYGSMWAGAWLVLLIACANLANLTLARSIGRSREFSTRIALGAGQWRMIRQILLEGLMLAGAGGLFGWWIAAWSVRTYSVKTTSIHRVLDYSINGSTMVYLAATAIVAVFLFSVIPMGRVLQLDLNVTLKGDARGVTHGARARSIAGVLVAAQMALAIVLLSGAGVLVRSFLHVVNADVGVRAPERVLTGNAIVPPEKYPTTESRNALFDRMKDRLEAIPGAEMETVASERPVDNPRSRPFELDGAVIAGASARPTVATLAAGANYFRAVGASTIAGRDFNDADGSSGITVVVVNQRFAALHWPGENAIGKRLRLFRGNTPGEWRTVVGVVSNVMQGSVTRESFEPLVYVPFREDPGTSAWFFLRTRVPAGQLASAAATEVRNLDADLDLHDLTTLKASFAFQGDRMDLAHQDMDRNAALAPIFAAVAMLLAAIGLYAVVSHSIGQRTKEIGIRMAVGAAAREIRRLVFSEGMVPVGIGLVLGLAASVGVNRLLQSQLVGISPYDPATLAGTPVVLIAVALLGCYIPAQRATRVDPVIALRQD